MAQARKSQSASRDQDADIRNLVQDFVRRSTNTQGLPEKVQDAATLRLAARTMRRDS